MISTTQGYKNAALRLKRLPSHLIQIEEYPRVFTNRTPENDAQVQWIRTIDDLNLTVADLEGGANLGQLSFTIQDHDGNLTADFPTFVFEGKRIWLKTGLVGMSQMDFPIRFVGKILSVASTNANLDYVFTCEDIRQDFSKVIYQQGDDGEPTESKHPRTINGHPLDILLNILTEELGLGPGDVETSRITTLRDTIYSGMQFTFRLTSPPVAKEFIENELLKPLGAYIWPHGDGRVSVNSFYPLKSAADLPGFFALTRANLIGVPIAEQAELIDTVCFRFDIDDQGQPLAEAVSNYQPAIDKYGLYGQHIIEANGVRSGFQGYYLSAFTAFLIFLRYGSKALRFGYDNDLLATWDACILEPGDGVILSHDLVPNRATGTKGILSMAFEVLGVTFHFQSGTVSLRLLDLTASMAFRIAKIAPVGMPNFTGASSSQKSDYMFMCDEVGRQSDGTKANVLS